VNWEKEFEKVFNKAFVLIKLCAQMYRSWREKAEFALSLMM
jgi:hypothetical protein